MIKNKLKNPSLATWLEHCITFIAELNNPLSLTIFEVVLHTIATGEITMLQSVLGSAAHHSIATKQSLNTFLKTIHSTKTIIMQRLEDEIDPSLMWEMLPVLEDVFQLTITISSRSYIDTLHASHQRQITETAHLHHQAEQKVLNYATDLARANRELARMEQAKTDFISIAAHELKTPLGVMQGYVDMLREQNAQANDNATNPIIKGIATGAQRLTNIVNDLLDVSALETNSLSLKTAPVVLNELIPILIKRAKNKAKSRQQHFQVEIEAELPLLYTDSVRLYQVLEQLINNAIKYTPDEGHITIKTYVYPKNKNAKSENDTSFINIEVTDTGIGIAPEDREHIFDKFYRVGSADLHSTGQIKFKGAGTGLGLAIAKGIIEAMGGKIWAESQGHDEVNFPGSTFHIRLPIKK
jgi:signal transduction histidine kinase